MGNHLLDYPEEPHEEILFIKNMNKKEKIHTKFWSENLKRDHLEDLDIDGRIISKWVLGK
jgi:hypothetical protein